MGVDRCQHSLHCEYNICILRYTGYILVPKNLGYLVFIQFYGSFQLSIEEFLPLIY